MSGALILMSLVALQSGDWSAALEREKRSLTEERAALRTALETHRAGETSTTKALERELETLTAQLARARAQNAAKTESFQGRQRLRSGEQQVDLSEDALSRARVWAKAKGLAIDPDDDARATFGSIASALAGQAGVRRTRAPVFDRAGVLAETDVVRLGVVAAWAIDEARAIPLEPAVGARGFEAAHGGGPRVTMGDFVIYESVLYDPEVPHEHAPEREGGLRAFLEAGGFVMYPLFFLGLIALLVALERVFALALATRAADAAPPLVRVTREIERGVDAALVEEHATEELLRYRGAIRARLSALNVVAAAAPLLGLLGTVTGMIGTFRVITEHGTGDPELLSGGISQALLTTQLGLAIAIPTLLVAAGINRWSQRLVSRAELSVLEALYPDEERAE